MVAAVETAAELATQPAMDFPLVPAWLKAQPYRWALALMLLLTSAAYILSPLREMIRHWNDFAFIYAAGHSWLDGTSPYDVERWRSEWSFIQPSFVIDAPTQPFLYPPHWAALATPLALLPWPVATRCWDMVNVLAYAGLCVFSLRLLALHERNAWVKPEVWLFTALATFNAAVRYALWECQMAVLPAFGIVGAFWAFHHRRSGWLVVFAFLASLKPQLGFLPLVFLLFNGAHKEVLLAGAVALLISLVAMSPISLAVLGDQLADCYQRHMSISFNAPENFFSVEALISSHAIAERVMVIGPAAAVAFIAFHAVRRRGSAVHPKVAPLWLAALTACASAVLVPLHGYDLVLYTPLVLLGYVMRPRWLGWMTVSLVELAGHTAALSARLHSRIPLAPILTLAIGIVCAVAFSLSRHETADGASIPV